MKLRAWTEDRDVRPLNTGGGMMETRRGDLVVCMVIERWDDQEKALEALRKLTRGEEP